MPCRLLLSLLLAAAVHAEPAGISPARTVGQVSEYRLANGLRILLVPDPALPVATLMVTYHVGSRNEVTGTTGATHLLEHLMFKGTQRFDRSKGLGYDQVLERFGAQINATTGLDCTNYFATLPANALPVLIELEADRMRNLTLRESDRRPEMVVVRNEFERDANNPYGALDKELWSSAFQAHPYHHNTIGWLSDIENVPIEKLRAFYDTYYWPNNATVTVIGGFDPDATLKEIAKHYGPIPASPQPIPEVYTEEPEQTGPRRVVVQAAGELGVVAIAHKTPQATHPDWPAVQVLSAILSDGKTSRCYRSLTDQSLTTEVAGLANFTRDASLHVLTAELTDGTRHDEVEKRLLAEIDKVKTTGVTAAEVQTAVAKLLAERSFARDGSLAKAWQLNECIGVGDWTLFLALDEKFRAVTATDVQRVATTYLTSAHSVTGWFIPASEQAAAPKVAKSGSSPELKTVVAPQAPAADLSPPAATDFATRVARLNVDGIDLLLCNTSTKDVISISGSLAAGEGASPNRALAHLAADMIQRGSKSHDQFAIARMLEDAGVALEFTVSADALSFEIQLLSKDLPLVLNLLAEQLRYPAFAPAEFAKAKTQLAAATQQALDDPNELAAIAFSQAIYPPGHPARRASIPEMLAAIKAAKLDDVRAFHASHYSPTGMHLAIAGDLTALGNLAALTEISPAFHGWTPQPPTPAADLPSPPAAAKSIPMPNKSSITVVLGQPSGLRASDPDWLPLTLATRALGRGFTSRLVGNVRDREGLTYGITSSLTDDSIRPGAWSITATFAPALLDQGITSTRRELTSWWRDGLTQPELDYQKSAAAGQFAVSLETTSGLASQLLTCAQRNLPLTWLDSFPNSLRSLTLDQVNASLKSHLDPEKMSLIQAGTRAE
jgi:zinc protease